MWEDPIVREIHKIRAKLLAEYDGDVDAYYRHIQQVAEEKRKRGVYYAEPPPQGDFNLAKPTPLEPVGQLVGPARVAVRRARARSMKRSGGKDSGRACRSMSTSRPTASTCSTVSP